METGETPHTILAAVYGVLCVSDATVKLLVEEGEEEGEGVKAVNMAESYLQTDMYRVTEQQLQEVELREREGRRENGGLQAVTYARNILWQVSRE